MLAIRVSVRVAPVHGEFWAMVTMGTAPIKVLHSFIMIMLMMLIMTTDDDGDDDGDD